MSLGLRHRVDHGGAGDRIYIPLGFGPECRPQMLAWLGLATVVLVLVLIVSGRMTPLARRATASPALSRSTLTASR